MGIHRTYTTDPSETQARVSTRGRIVEIQIAGTPCNGFGMEPHEARAIARALMEAADYAERKTAHENN